MRLDIRDKFPSGMEEYLSHYGWHFSKKMAEWASKNMYRLINGRKEIITPYTKDLIHLLAQNFGIHLESTNDYDCVFIANMCKASYLGDAILDESYLIRFVKNTLECPYSYKEMPFTRFYADCIGKGIPINWEDML